MLLAVTAVVPVLVYAAAPRPSTGLLTTSTTQTSQAATSFSGEAFGASVSVLGGAPITCGDTGMLDSSGGMKNASETPPVILPIGTAAICDAFTLGFDSTAKSGATIADLSITIPPLEPTFAVTADFVMANSMATCKNGVASVSGSSDITNLVLDGLGNFTNPLPNTNVPNNLGLTITLNEQTGTSNSITVNAIHISEAGVIDVIISSAHSDITCAAPAPHVQHDFMTGGGWIQLSGGKGTFGFVAGFKDHSLTPSGHLTYIDHSTGMKVMSTDVMHYGNSLSCPDANQRTFSGDARINGISGYTYTVCATDIGEPGAGNDLFNMTLSTGYSASGTLGGGNIEIHN